MFRSFRNLFFIFSTLFFVKEGQSQIIDFSDLALKDFLINEACVDTTALPNGWSGQIDVDLNNNNEIEVSEALMVQNLYLKNETSSYWIKSLEDLVYFENIRFLTLVYADSLEEVSSLPLDSLHSLHILNSQGIKRIDLSNLTHLTTSIRLEGLTMLDYLNIQNGNVPSVFSLFYSINIQYACVDDIPSEYNAFNTFGAMADGISPSYTCEVLEVPKMTSENYDILLYPNPASSILTIQSPKKILSIRILDLSGRILRILPIQNSGVDISFLDQGAYLLDLEFESGIIRRRFTKVNPY